MQPFATEADVYLLYADESGSISDPTQKFFVLAGVSVFERGTHSIELELNKIASRFEPGDPHSIELHGSPMRAGTDGWRQHPQTARKQAMIDALTLAVCQKHPHDVRLFAIALEKKNFSGKDIAQIAFEQLSSRFDQFLQRLYRSGSASDRSGAQRGLILFDESSTENRIQRLAREFKYRGHSFGVTRNYVEVPVFLNSRASRLIQLADLVAYSTFRHFEHADDTLFSLIRGCFDAEGGVQHGLYVR